jgi:mannose-1-phosphate guanylyltransferase
MDRGTSAGDLNRAAIILAGGEGRRLSELTRQIAGFHLPKQFCAVVGEIPLLEQTRRRVLRCVRQERICFVLNGEHQSFFTPLLDGVPARNLVVQPGNRGTAPAILYSLLRLAELAPSASALLMPSDHYVADEAALVDYINFAFAAVEERPELTVLLGIVPDQPETAYGWIEPGAALHIGRCNVLEVRRFLEKPSARIVRELMAAGCLWNSFMIVGRVETLLELFAIAMPRLHRAFSKIRPILGTCFEQQTVERLYEDLPSIDFSREVLEPAAVNLAVLPVRDIGWTDLGEPARVVRALGSLGIQQKWASVTIGTYVGPNGDSRIDSKQLSAASHS